MTHLSRPARSFGLKFLSTPARVTRMQYEAGMITYLDVAITENSGLSAQQSLLTLQSTQWVSSVALIAALGGGWQAP